MYLQFCALHHIQTDTMYVTMYIAYLANRSSTQLHKMLFSNTPTPAHRAGPGGSSYQLDAQVRTSDKRCQESSEPNRETQSTPTDHTGASNQDENSLVGSRDGCMLWEAATLCFFGFLT